jgi:hypothetical protein
MISHVTCQRSIFRVIKLFTQKRLKALSCTMSDSWSHQSKKCKTNSRGKFVALHTENDKVVSSNALTPAAARAQGVSTKQNDGRARCTRSLLHSAVEHTCFHLLVSNIPQRTHPSELLGVLYTYSDDKLVCLPTRG